MAYTIPEIIEWAKISQALAARGEVRKRVQIGGRQDKDLHIKLYVERKSLEWEYAQDNASEYLFQIGNWVYALCFPFLFEAQQAAGAGGGAIAIPGVPVVTVSPQQFEVSSGSFVPTGTTTIVFPSEWRGLNILFFRNYVTQGTIVLADAVYYSWESSTATFTLLGPLPTSGAAQAGEYFQIFPIL